MGWSLRLVERVEGGDGRSVDVIDIGEITVPTELATLGLTMAMGRSVLARLQTEIVARQEAALTEAARRSSRPIKDHRRRVPQTPFGAVAMRVPRLRRRGADAKITAWPRHARATPEFDRPRARLAAWMSYPAAMALLDELYPASAGVGRATAHRTSARVAKEAAVCGCSEDAPLAARATLQLETTFVRSADPARPRGLEIVVGAIEPEGGGRRCFAAPVSLREESLAVGRCARRRPSRRPPSCCRRRAARRERAREMLSSRMAPSFSWRRLQAWTPPPLRRYGGRRRDRQSSVFGGGRRRSSSDRRFTELFPAAIVAMSEAAAAPFAVASGDWPGARWAAAASSSRPTTSVSLRTRRSTRQSSIDSQIDSAAAPVGSRFSATCRSLPVSSDPFSR